MTMDKGMRMMLSNSEDDDGGGAGGGDDDDDDGGGGSGLPRETSPADQTAESPQDMEQARLHPYKRIVRFEHLLGRRSWLAGRGIEGLCDKWYQPPRFVGLG